MIPSLAKLSRVASWRRALVLAIAALPASPMAAQTAAPAPAPASPPAGSPASDVIELSPFVITADSEEGYLATETLSGTRMRTQLGDTAASVEALTKELLRDVAATDMYSALDLVGSVSTYAKSGGVNDVENNVWFSNPYMARGFTTAAVTSDFFSLGKIPLDFYNRTNVTVARGPNAILYGIGSPGGIVNASRQRPTWGKDATELQVKVDSYGSVRANLDITRELIERKLAVSVSLLRDDRNEFLKPAGFLREGAYGSFEYRPFRRTTITGMAEAGSEFRTFQYNTTQYDGITPWINAGRPTYRGFNNNPAINQNFGSGLDREARIAVLVSGRPDIPILNWQNMARTERWEIAGYPTANANDPRQRSFTEDSAVWDYDQIQLAGDSRQRALNWEDYAVFVTQEITPDLVFEVAYNRSETEYMVSSHYGQVYLQMDVNELLPNGSPNPYFLTPYVESDRVETIAEINTRDTLRATLSWMVDLNDRDIFGIKLGRYNLMGLAEEERVNSKFASFRRAFATSLTGFPVNDINNVSNRVRTRTYVNTTFGSPNANVQPYFRNDWTPIDRNGVSDAWYGFTSPRDIDDTRSSQVAALQAYLWPTKQEFDRVILTAGYRRDRQTSQRKNYVVTNGVYQGSLWRGDPFALDDASARAIWDGQANYGTWGDETVTDEPTMTYSALFKVTKDISFFYNYSDVMISSSSLVTDIYDDPLGPTVGKTNDIGLRLNLFKGKLVASLTRFETSAENQQENTIRTIFTPELEDIWTAVDPQRQIHTGFNERYVTLRNDTSEGLEFNLTANLVRGWTTRLSISQIETIIDSRLPVVQRYIQEFSPLWEANRNVPLSSSDQRVPDYLTVGDALNSLNTDIANLLALVGTVPQAQREWKVVLNSSYNFRGVLRGWTVGGGFRWESADTIGYAFDLASLADPTRPVVVDADKPFKGESLLDVNAFIAYQRTIAGVWTRFQLNVGNVLGKDGMFARSAVDDLNGGPYYGRQQVREPRNFSLTATFRF